MFRDLATLKCSNLQPLNFSMLKGTHHRRRPDLAELEGKPFFYLSRDLTCIEGFYFICYVINGSYDSADNSPSSEATVL